MLATETVKLLLGQPLSPHIPGANNVTFQFLKPAAITNAARILARDPACRACPPTGAATLRWQHRYEQARFPTDTSTTAIPSTGLRLRNRQATRRGGTDSVNSGIAPGSLTDGGGLLHCEVRRAPAMMAP
jgi:hypothetical protein